MSIGDREKIRCLKLVVRSMNPSVYVLAELKRYIVTLADKKIKTYGKISRKKKLQ